MLSKIGSSSLHQSQEEEEEEEEAKKQLSLGGGHRYGGFVECGLHKQPRHPR